MMNLDTEDAIAILCAVVVVTLHLGCVVLLY